MRRVRPDEANRILKQSRSREDQVQMDPGQARRLPSGRLSPGQVLQLQRTIGNRATAELIQRQTGSGRLVSGASALEPGIDEGSFTEQIAAGKDVTGAYQAAAAKGVGKISQHPSIAELGIRPEKLGGKKYGVYVGNRDYGKEVSSLPGAVADARRIMKLMRDKGHKTLEMGIDATRAEMEAKYQQGLNTAGPGDSLFMYYAGHGYPAGLLGVDWDADQPHYKVGTPQEQQEQLKQRVKAGDPGVVPQERLVSYMEQSVSKGVHTTMIVDACYAGAGTDLVRSLALKKAGQSRNEIAKLLVSQAHRLEDVKRVVLQGGEWPEVKTGDSKAEPVDEKTRGVYVAKNVPDIGETTWRQVVYPELALISHFLKISGHNPVPVPRRLSAYYGVDIEQQINRVINRLIDAAEQETKDQQELEPDPEAQPAATGEQEE